MTAIQAQAIQKSVRYIMNTQGEETDIVFSLSDKHVQEFFEDLFDTLVSVEREDEKGIPFADFKAEFYKRKALTA